MKFYLAARFGRRQEMLDAKRDLEGRGHVVTSRWINGSHDFKDSDDAAQATGFAHDDLEDLKAADAVICFTEQPRTHLGRGGRHVKLGMGLGLGKRSVVIGPCENVFHYLRSVSKFPTLSQFITELLVVWETLEKVLKVRPIQPYREFGCDCRAEMEKLLIERLGAESEPHFRDRAMMINEDAHVLFTGWMGLRVSYFPKDRKGNLAKKKKDTWLRFSHCPFCGNKKVEFPKPEQKETA